MWKDEHKQQEKSSTNAPEILNNIKHKHTLLLPFLHSVNYTLYINNEHVHMRDVTVSRLPSGTQSKCGGYHGNRGTSTQPHFGPGSPNSLCACSNMHQTASAFGITQGK